MRMLIVLVILSFASGMGCFGGVSNVVKPEVAKKHGAAQLGCDPGSISVTKIDDTTWKAEGCGASTMLKCWTSPGQGEGTCVKQ